MRRRKTFSIKGIVVLIIIAVFLNLCFKKKMLIDDLKTQIAQQENKIEKLNTEIDDLKEKTKLGKSLEFVESVARDELNMVKEGEYIYKINVKDPQEASE